jgi:hypothetical protein
VRGTIYSDGNGMQIRWNEEDIQNPRFSPKFISKHLELIATLAKKFYAEDQAAVKERMKKYREYGNIIKP